MPGLFLCTINACIVTWVEVASQSRHKSFPVIRSTKNIPLIYYLPNNMIINKAVTTKTDYEIVSSYIN